MGTAPAEIEAPYAVIAGAGLPLGPLSELARWVEAAAHAGAESPAAAAAVERALAALRAAWPGLEPAERALLGELVTDLVARRPAPGEPGATPSGEPLEAALALLGVRRLRPGQDRAIAAGLAGRDALVVMATGSGKSLCYQAPATVLSGLTVVVSPLIALMADQLARAGARRRRGGHAQLRHARGAAAGRARGGPLGAISLLYVAPERFHSASFRAALAASPIALLVVDEAHCVSEWGHEFRPDYRRVGQFRAEIGSPPTMALTATATPRVQADIARRLGLRRPVTVVGGFDRPNITFDALWVEGKGSVARKRGAMLAALEAAGGGKAIVYCGTRKASDETAELLRSSGYAAVAYHAGRTDRTEAQEAFTSGSAQVVAATNAFGMGVNVPDVRLVVHTALPDSLEQLYQEAGRAGRDGDPARHVIVAGPADEAAIRRRIARARIEPADVERLVGRLAARADGEGRFHLDRAEVDDETGVQLAIAERAGALEQRGAPGGGREGRLAAPRLTLRAAPRPGGRGAHGAAPPLRRASTGRSPTCARTPAGARRSWTTSATRPIPCPRSAAATTAAPRSTWSPVPPRRPPPRRRHRPPRGSRWTSGGSTTRCAPGARRWRATSAGPRSASPPTARWRASRDRARGRSASCRPCAGWGPG